MTSKDCLESGLEGKAVAPVVPRLPVLPVHEVLAKLLKMLRMFLQDLSGLHGRPLHILNPFNHTNPIHLIQAMSPINLNSTKALNL